MGLFAIIAVLITLSVVWSLVFGDGKEAEREARREEVRRGGQSSGPQMGEASARMGSALEGLNNKLPFLGGQSGFQLPPPPEGEPIEDIDEVYTEVYSEEPAGWGDTET